MATNVNSNILDQIVSILEKETGGTRVDPQEVQVRLANIINSAGLFTVTDDMSVDEIEFGKAFKEASSTRPKNAEAKQRVQHYEKILASPNPLGDGLIHGIYRTEINAYAKDRKLKITSPMKERNIQFPSPRLTERLEHDLTLLRQATEALKVYHESRVKMGAPPKVTQRTLLFLLSDYYVEVTGKDIDPKDLPHSVNSRFIQFCHLALRSYFGKTEVSKGSLATAWNRLKAAEKDQNSKESTSR